jgi:hypothetical protein
VAVCAVLILGIQNKSNTTLSEKIFIRRWIFRNFQMGLETSVALAFIILVFLSSDNKTLPSWFDLKYKL